MYEISINRVFAAGHALRLYDGSVEPIHSHDWRLEVTVGARKLDGIDVVMDFHLLEGLVDGLVACVEGQTLNDLAPFRSRTRSRSGPRARAPQTGVNPTAERVAWWVGREVARGLPRGVNLVSVRIEEAPGCFATYRP
jgi:6-pyruvoyltetrahydropterin/6-carboxytetrahydropterin synthase